ncbi:MULTISPECIES: TcaA second domain-containing protein [Staphylococcus]|uniref:TcaA second domain-containing protein n=1 Tax=Staphylococcus TaxID=1279 RepID=UPI0009110F4E|nr:hypothetical protein [Staphylococcus argenteus]SGX30032.1 membrane protein-like protein [Staphylococcus argenteus]
MDKDNKESYIRLTEEEKVLLEEHRRKRKRWIVRGIIIVFVFLIALAIYLFAVNKGTSGQINEFDKAVKDKDYDKLTEIVKSGQKDISTTDAKHFVDYINRSENKSRYNEEIKKMKKALDDKDKHDSEVGKITDKNGHTIIDITRNGNKFLVLNDLAFEPNFYDVYINEGNNNASYEFENNGKRRKIVSNSNSQTELGQFFVGDYDVETTKNFKDKPLDGSVDGQLHINTDNMAKGSKIFAEEKIPQAWFKVKIKNSEVLDKGFKLNVDDNEIEYDKNEVYGKYPADVPITISANGSGNNETLETEKVEVKANKNNRPQVIELAFKDSDINRQKKMNKEIEKDAKKFMEDYTKKLNTGYEVSDFSALQYYFEDKNSDVAKNIKKQVESKKKSKFTKPEIQSYKRDDTNVKLTLSKKDKQNRVITSEYELIYDYKEKEFKIKDYTDI